MRGQTHVALPEKKIDHEALARTAKESIPLYFAKCIEGAKESSRKWRDRSVSIQICYFNDRDTRACFFSAAEETAKLLRMEGFTATVVATEDLGFYDDRRHNDYMLDIELSW